MIVTCERCASQFQLDETKIPSKGVRLRCSRCEHSFFVESPARPDTDHAADLVRDVLGDAKRDSDAPNPPSSSEFPTDSSGSPVLEPAEDDWEFNDDGGSIASSNDGGDGASTDELSAARDAVDDLLGGEPNLGISTTVAEAADPESSSALDLDDDFRLDVDSSWQADGAGESGSIDAPIAASVAAIVEV